MENATLVTKYGRDGLIYNVVAGLQARDRSKPFVTNPAIRQAIGRMGLEMPYSIGRIAVNIDRSKARTLLHTVSFFPFDEEAAYRHLRGKGVGSLIELAMEGDLMKRFPGALIRATSFRSLSRTWQLVARDRRPGKAIPIEEAYALTKKHVLEERRRIRSERKMTPWKRRLARGKRFVKKVGRLLRYG